MEEQDKSAQPDLPPPDAAEKPQHIKIGGRFGQYDSSFWKAALAILGVRYLPRPFLKATESWDSKTPQNFFSKHLYAASAGTIMEGVTLYFAKKTWNDMHSIFNEALAWELDKKPKDIGFADFKKSKNTIVQQTIGNYIHRNVQRIGYNLVFFSPYIFGPIFKKFNILKGKWHPDHWKSENGVDLGVGALATYLFRDVRVRKMSAFESLQNIIDRKINHSDHPGDAIEVTDLLDIYERNAANSKIASFLRKRGTPDWDRSMTIFARMTDLMNETYKNTAPSEKADFGMPEFIYMAGNRLIQPEKVEQTLAYIEVANRHGIPALKKLAKAVEEGVDLSEALKDYPLPPAPEAAKTPEIAPSADRKYADALTPGRAIAEPPAAYAAKMAKEAAEPNYGLSA